MTVYSCNFTGIHLARIGEEPEVPPPVVIPQPKPYNPPLSKTSVPPIKSSIPYRKKTPEPVPTAPVRVSHKPKREPSPPKEDTPEPTPEPAPEPSPVLTPSPPPQKTPTPRSNKGKKQKEKSPSASPR